MRRRWPSGRRAEAWASRAWGGLAGLALLGAASAGVRAIPVPPVWLERDVPASAGAASVDPREWRGRYSPAAERGRLTVTLDRAPAGPLRLEGDDGVALPLPALSPGVHFVELTMTRRGGRTSRVVDEIWLGPWQSERGRGCDVGLVLSAEGLRELLLPVLEAKLLSGARASPYFGETSVLSRRELDVVDGGLRFSVFLDTDEEDRGDLSVAGIIDVRAQGDAGIVAELRRLDEAVPGPKLEAMARSEGRERLGALGVTVGGGIVAATGGGALLGLAAAAGGGYLGSRFGERIGERTARREVRREAAAQIERALAVATDALRLPARAELLPTEPALRADLRWCGEPTLRREVGLEARLSVALHVDDASERAAAESVLRGVPLPEPRPPGAGANVRVDVSEDLLNRLLAEWSARGGLNASLDASGLASEVQAALWERTRWRVRGLTVERAPVLTLREDGRIEAALAGVALALHDPGRGVARTVVLGAVGELEIEPLAAAGRLRLLGALDEVYFGCRERSGAVERRLPCFSSAVDPDGLKAQLSAHVRERSDRLPGLDPGAVLRRSTVGGGTPRALTLTAIAVEVGEGRLSLEARVR